MSDAAQHLPNCYAIRGGQIDPWGTIRLLSKKVGEPAEDGKNYTDFKDCIDLQPGLKVWCEKLVSYGKMGGYRAVVGMEVVEVVAEDGSIVEEIPHTDFTVVQIHECYVNELGYLEYCLGHEDEDCKGMWSKMMQALKEAARGERPSFLDNSPFVQVDEKLVGREVIQLAYGMLDTESAVVYTKDGERIPSKHHYPISFAKWEPTSPYARYSRADAVQN